MNHLRNQKYKKQKIYNKEYPKGKGCPFRITTRF